MMVLQDQNPCKFRVKHTMRKQLFDMLSKTPPHMEIFAARPRIELLSIDEEDESEHFVND